MVPDELTIIVDDTKDELPNVDDELWTPLDVVPTVDDRDEELAIAELVPTEEELSAVVVPLADRELLMELRLLVPPLVAKVDELLCVNVQNFEGASQSIPDTTQT